MDTAAASGALDIRHFDHVVACFEDFKPDIVVHLAAQTSVPDSIFNSEYDEIVNVNGTLNLLRAAHKHGCKRFVFASSAAPLGDCQQPMNEGLPPAPKSPYGASKLAGEGYCSAFFHSYGLETVALRFSNVYGPRSLHKTSVVSEFIRAIIDRRQIVIYGDGEQTRDYIHVDDVCAAIQSAVDRRNRRTAISDRDWRGNQPKLPRGSLGRHNAA